MFDDFEKLQELMQTLANDMDGYYVANEDISNCTMVKDEFIFQYRFPDRYTLAVFSVMTPFPLPQKTSIRIDKANKVSLVKRYHTNEVFDIVVENDDVFGKDMVDGLLMDYTFISNFKRMFNKDFIIYISDNTISVLNYRTVQKGFINLEMMTKDELIAMMDIASEVKKALEYYLKRN